MEPENRTLGGGDEGRHIAVDGGSGLLAVLRRQAVAWEGNLVEEDRGFVMAHRKVLVAVEDILGVDNLAVVEGSLAGPANGLHSPAGKDSPAEEDTEDIGRVEVAGNLLLCGNQQLPVLLGIP